jgi:hypothetical protein
MISVAMASAASCCAVGPLIVVPAGDQLENEIGSHTAQGDSSHYAQQCKPDSGVGAAAKDESGATGNSKRGQRFLFYVFADVAILPMPFLVCFHCGRPC